MYHPSFNIGIEEEYQIVDPESGELLGFISQSMSEGRLAVQERRPDFHIAQELSDAVLGDVASHVDMQLCADIPDARSRLMRTRREILELAAIHHVKIVAAGTHPFSSWDESVTPPPRYRTMVEDAQMIARRMLAFGLHVHIGIEDRELAVDVMNGMTYLLPHILALSTSSPFWLGRNTGLKGYRKVVMDALPRTGIPGYFRSYQEYHGYVDTLVRTHSIADPGKIWYDILPHHRMSTLTVRICDMVPSVDDTLAIAALIQATAAWMVDLRERNMSFRIYDRTLINENRWRAIRYGLDGTLIDFGVEEEKPARELIREMLDRVEPFAVRLNASQELEHIYTMLERGSSADGQIAAWRAADEDVRAVVAYLIQETEKLS